MTWKKIIDTNNIEEYERKAEKQKFVFMLYSTKSPYLPIDFAYSLYEITKRYKVNYSTLRSNFSLSGVNKLGFTIEKIYIDN